MSTDQHDSTAARLHYNFTRQHRREQLAALLHEATAPLTAKEIGVKLGHTWIQPCSERGHHWYLISCSGDYDVRGYRPGQTAANWDDLKALHKAGLIGRQKVDRSVYWFWTGPRPDLSEIAHLDFPAPSDIDLEVEALTQHGVEVEWVDQPPRSSGENTTQVPSSTESTGRSSI